jgi:hypothetical protein
MRDYNWLYDIVGIMLLVSILYMGLKKVISFIIDVSGFVIGFVSVFISFILAYVITCLMRIVFDGMLVSIGIPAVSNEVLSYIFLIIVSMVMMIFIGSLLYWCRCDW